MLVVRTTPSPLLLRRRKAPSPFRYYYHPSLLPLPPYASSYTIDYVRSQSAFQRSRVLYPRRELPYTLLSQSRLISRLAGSVCIPQINLLYLSNPSSSLFFYNSSQLSPNFTSIRSLAGEKSKFFEWIFPSRTKEEGACTDIVVSQVCWTNTRWWGGARSKWSLIFEEIRSVFHR